MTEIERKGTVYLVGAGPGDPGLLTVRAAELLAEADTVVYDYLVHPGLLDRCRADCERIYVGKKAGFHSVPQEEIEQILVREANAGKTVVRLKGGDPFVYGRGGEEARTLAANGIPFAVVPGVTAAVAAGACAGIPLTQRNTRDLWIETARNDLEKLISRIDLFLLNDDEAALMTDEPNIIRAGRALLKKGPKMVVIKKGAHGSVLFCDDKLFVLPAFPVTDLRDPTGAGDSYLGAMAGYMAAEGNTDLPTVKKSLVYATAAASITVESFGCDHLQRAGREEIDRRFERLLEISQL